MTAWRALLFLASLLVAVVATFLCLDHTSAPTSNTKTERSGQQIYEWSCSSLDPSTNLYTLPDLPVKNPGDISSRDLTEFIAIAPEDSTVYSIPPTLNCTGAVSAVEFCYASISHFHTEEHVYKLLILNKNDSSFTVTNTIDIYCTPSPGICANRTLDPERTIQYCCDKFSLNSQDQFRLPADNFAFGLTSPYSTRRRLSYSDNRYPDLIARDFELDITGSAIPAEGSTFTLTEQRSDRTLELFNFVLGPVTTATTDASTELSLPTDAHTSFSASTPSSTSTPHPTPSPSPTPSHTHNSILSLTHSSISMSVSDISITATPVVSPAHLGVSDTASATSPGIKIGIAVGVPLSIVILLLLLFITVKFGKQVLSHNPDHKDAAQCRDVDCEAVTSADPLFNHYRRMASMLEYQKRNFPGNKLTDVHGSPDNRLTDVLGCPDNKLADVVITTSNEAYGISMPSKLQDGDLYENIDSMATFFTYSTGQSLESDTSCHVSTELKFGSNESQADMADIIVADNHGVITLSEVALNQAYGTQRDSQQAWSSEGVSEADETGSRQEFEHEYADIPVMSDSLSHEMASHLSSTHDSVSATAEQEETYEDIEDTVDSSVHVVMPYPNDAHGMHDELAVISSSHASGVSAATSTDWRSAVGVTTAKVLNIGSIDALQYETIADAMQSAGYEALVTGNQAFMVEESGTQGSRIRTDEDHGVEVNHYEHIPADNPYDTIGPVAE